MSISEAIIYYLDAKSKSCQLNKKIQSKFSF